MIIDPELVEGEVDFSTWEFGCGSFENEVRAAAQAAVANTLAEEPPTIYMKKNDPPLTIRIWMSFLADQDHGPIYRFGLEELLEEVIGDCIGGGPENANGSINERGAGLITELEAMVLRIKKRHKHREIIGTDSGRLFSPPPVPTDHC